jgi:hypothetical protein
LTPHLHLPKGYSVSFGGAYQEQQQSFHELMMILCLATLLVMCVLMFLFREWRISFAVLFISVTGICGSLLALWLTGVPLNVSSYTGIIMIVGIIAENAIFTVHQYNMKPPGGRRHRRIGQLCHRSPHTSQTDDRHIKHPRSHAPRIGTGGRHTDAAAAGGSSHRRILCRAATAVGRVAQFDDGHL